MTDRNKNLTLIAYDFVGNGPFRRPIDVYQADDGKIYGVSVYLDLEDTDEDETLVVELDPNNLFYPLTDSDGFFFYDETRPHANQSLALEELGFKVNQHGN